MMGPATGCVSLLTASSTSAPSIASTSYRRYAQRGFALSGPGSTFYGVGGWAQD